MKLILWCVFVTVIQYASGKQPDPHPNRTKMSKQNMNFDVGLMPCFILFFLLCCLPQQVDMLKQHPHIVWGCGDDTPQASSIYTYVYTQTFHFPKTLLTSHPAIFCTIRNCLPKTPIYFECDVGIFWLPSLRARDYIHTFDCARCDTWGSMEW